MNNHSYVGLFNLVKTPRSKVIVRTLGISRSFRIRCFRGLLFFLSMSDHGAGDSGGLVGPDFNLPDDILSVIPADPYDQLDLARKIASMAISSRVTQLEMETSRLRRNLHLKDRVMEELEDKVSLLETAYHKIELQLIITREDNSNLLKERDSLASTLNKLGRDLAKLETFKRQLIQSLNGENSPLTDAVDIGTYDQPVSLGYSTNDEESNGYSKYNSYGRFSDSASINEDVSKQTGRTFFMPPNGTPSVTPMGTPKVISTSVSPRRYSAADSPRRTSGTTSPTAQSEGSVSSWYPSSQQSSGTSTPALGCPLPARPPRIDRKEFFRQVRNRLSLEQFRAFLANIKELNAQRQSCEETLRKAQEIFGIDGKDLYVLFQGLLSHHMH